MDIGNKDKDGLRNCIFTGKPSAGKKRVLQKDYTVKTHEDHNWANKAPINKEYNTIRGTDIPTDLELEANEVFHLLELARLRVKVYELRLKNIQDKILQENVGETSTVSEKMEEIKTEEHVNRLLDEANEKIEAELAKRKRTLWE